MNYFAHGLRFVERPYYLVGTAAPDLLSVADRKTRLRAKNVEPFVSGAEEPVGEFAAGVLQHLDDDRWFHKSRAFFEVTGELTRLFRKQMAGDDRFRASFLGHIVTELLLDRVLCERYPRELDRYYSSLADIDTLLVERAVNRMVREPTRRLATFLGLFQRERFLYDYADPERLLVRLNQVMGRVRLPRLPAETIEVFEVGEAVVRQRRRDLLPPEHFEL